MTKQILITGGAGFIGSHTADALLAQGYKVRVLDALIAQVHPTQARPDYLTPDVELIVGDICDATAVSAALAGVDIVYHLPKYSLLNSFKPWRSLSVFELCWSIF